MSPKLPAMTSKELARIARQLGFEFRRQKGSHAIYVRASDNRRVVIPMHSGQDLNTKDIARHYRGLGHHSR